MIKVIAGKKGTGKTKRILDMANTASQNRKHDIVFIDDDNRYMFDLRHEIRFVNACEYQLANDYMFVGLLCGIVAQNFDVGYIFIDAFRRLVKADLSQCEWVFRYLNSIAEKHNVEFVLSIGEDPDEMPQFIRDLVI